MLYQAKPQRGGRSIPCNSNTPPQDPPGPPNEIITSTPEIDIPVEIPVVVPKPIIKPIEEMVAVPLITESTVKPFVEGPLTPRVMPSKSIKTRIVNFIKKIFRRN